VREIRYKLLNMTPSNGQQEVHYWTLQDPITARQDTRAVLYQHPPRQGPAELTFNIRVPWSVDLSPALRFAIAQSPDVWSPSKGDGAGFKVHIAQNTRPDDEQVAFARYINPKHNPSDRRWRSFIVDLSPWQGRTIDLSLMTSAGPNGDWGFDWSGWAHPEVVMVEPSLFDDHLSAPNPVRRHAQSILDWVRDETNRDRLAAWNMSWDAWRTAPFWGQGLGATGVAALRTHPERAFVTESQVLKSLVELGLPGLLALVFLWFQIARIGYRTYRAALSQSTQSRVAELGDTAESIAPLLVAGTVASLAIIFVEGWVYQNLEVKQVNAYFWTLVGMLGCLAQRPQADG
jgi:hypothetical protein